MFKSELHVVCHNIRSLFNVGSIFRTADAAKVTELHLCGYTGHPPRKEISKVSLGAEESVRWSHHYQTWRVLDRLKERGFQVLALENNLSKPVQEIQSFKPSFPVALVIGNEVSGLSDGLIARAEHIVAIPMHGEKESLNVSVAFGIAVYELNRHRK